MVKNKPAKDKDKDKEALFIVRHNNIFKRYFPALGWLVGCS